MEIPLELMKRYEQYGLNYDRVLEILEKDLEKREGIKEKDSTFYQVFFWDDRYKTSRRIIFSTLKEAEDFVTKISERLSEDDWCELTEHIGVKQKTLSTQKRTEKI